MHPHNPRSEAREVDGVKFKQTGPSGWSTKVFTNRFTTISVSRGWNQDSWEVNWPSLGGSTAADAAVFAQAIGAAAKLADELNERKE